MTPDEAARALTELMGLVKEGVKGEIDRGLRDAHKLALTRYMVGGRTIMRKGRARSGPLQEGKRRSFLRTRVSDPADPPNPPPGPLKKRSGNLARAVFVIPFRWKGDSGQGALAINDAAAPYGKVHEFGGIRVPVPARPFLQPSIDDVTPRIQEGMNGIIRPIAERLRLL